MPKSNDDGRNNPAPEGSQLPASPAGLGGDEYSRRKFLRAAVIGTAGVAGAASVAGVVLAQRGVAPGLLSVRQVSGTSASNYTILFEDTNCGTSGTCGTCGNFSTTTFTVSADGTTTNPGSFFVVLAIRSLPAGTYSLLAQEKLSTASTYANIPAKGAASSSLPFAYQSNGGNVQVYEYHTGTVAASGPYGLTCSAYVPNNSNPNWVNTAGLAAANGAADTFTTGSTLDVLIFIHVNWGGGTIPGGKGATETIDFQVTITNTLDNSNAVETTTTTGVQG